MSLDLYSDVFIDKLGETIAFEREVAGLYLTLLSQYDSCDDQSILPPKDLLEQFYLEEKKHLEIAYEAMTETGSEPQALPRQAALSGGGGAGWAQIMKDPGTSFLQGLEVILQTELINNVCWNTLIELAVKLNGQKTVEHFKMVLEEKDRHLIYVRLWLKQLQVHGRVFDVQMNFNYKLLASVQAEMNDDILFENPYKKL